MGVFAMYVDRVDAGRQLAERLQAYRAEPNAIVLGIPRGGVVVAAEVARALGLPLDVAVAAKVSAPGSPEFAVGAVAPDGEVSVNPIAGLTAEEVRGLSAPAHDKVERYASMLRGDCEPRELANLTVILVDDGLATGLTALAAAEWIRRQGAGCLVVAVPVASASAVAVLHEVADEVVAASMPPGFHAVGQFYQHFGQTQDAEVLQILGSQAAG
jgi:predicted phosphoribosyltransferase